MNKLVAHTPTLDTSIYASGDLLADTKILTGANPAGNGVTELRSIMINDKDAQGVAMTIFLLDTLISMGTINSAPNISDANLDKVVAIIPVATTDYVTVSGAKVATIRNIGAMVKGVSSRNLYVALLNGTGTPTFTASGLVLRFGFYDPQF